MHDPFTPIAPFTTITTDEQGTLTLTKDGPVLGMPRGAAPEMRAEAEDRIRKWIDTGGLLTLPFPVYVQDARY